MKQTTKNILGVAAIVLLSSGVAGLTTYKMLNKEKPAAFSGFPCNGCPACGFDTSSGEFAPCCSAYTCHSVE